MKGVAHDDRYRVVREHPDGALEPVVTLVATTRGGIVRIGEEVEQAQRQLDHVPPLGEDLPQPARWMARGGGWRYVALGRFRPVRETATHVHFATIDR